MSLDAELLAYWPLQTDLADHGPQALTTVSHAVEMAAAPETAPHGAATAAVFDGQGAYLEVPADAVPDLGRKDFSAAAWIHTDEVETDVVGDVLGCFDADRRRGWGLSVVSNCGVTIATQGNHRQPQFGIDDGVIDGDWTDHGQVGNAAKVAALHTSEGRLFASTFEPGPEDVGGLYVFTGGDTWQLLGRAPQGCNTVGSIARFDGDLYVATGRYNPAGSCMGPAQNARPGGKIYRLAADGSWADAGHPGSEDAVPESTDVGDAYNSGKADDAFALTVYRGDLFVVSNHRRNAFRYEGDGRWKNIGLDSRLFSFSIYRGRLYALANGGPVYRYDGDDNWAYCGKPETSTQTYGGMVVDDQFYVGTWPQGEVYRYEGGEKWSLVSRVGYCREVMAMACYNQKGYVGTLPMANVWRLDGGYFNFVGNLDNTRQAYLRRVWSMAVYQGRLFAGTLPSGHVLSLQAGAMATADRGLAGGWRHLAAVREGAHLKLYVDGALAATSARFDANRFDLSNGRPLQLGRGGHTCFTGRMLDVRLYGRALAADEVTALARLRS